MVESTMTGPINLNSQIDSSKANEATANQLLLTGEDLFSVAFFLIVEAVNLSSQNGAIIAKGLDINANGQHKLNDLIQMLHLYGVPDEMINTNNGVTEVKNLSTVRNVEARNQIIQTLKSHLEAKQGVSQQNAQSEENNMNVQAQEGLKSEKEGSAFVKQLQDLLYKVLLRKPPNV